MAEWIRAVGTDEVPEGTLKAARVGGELIVLANVDGDIYALEDQCSHQDLPLSDGELDGGDVVCLYHGARFDACTGKNRSLPAVRPVRSFPVEIRDGDVFVDVG